MDVLREEGCWRGSWGLSVLSVQRYPLLPGLLLGSQQCTHSIGNALSVNIFANQPCRELLHASPH